MAAARHRWRLSLYPQQLKKVSGSSAKFVAALLHLALVLSTTGLMSQTQLPEA
jgi:hypothetical protein